MSDTSFPINTICFERTPEGKRKCKLCSALYNGSTSSDSLRVHWHSQHPDEAKANKVPLPSRDRRLSFASSSISSSSSLFSPHSNAGQAQAEPDTESIILDGPLQSSPILQSTSSSHSIFSASSIASSPSLPSSLSNKRVSAPSPRTFSLMSPPSSPPQPSKRLRQQDIRKHDSTAQQKSDAALTAQTAFFLYEGLALRIADSHYLREWLDAYVLAAKAGAGAVANQY